jgi:phytanoyl-CoA hydroxylase
MLDRAHQLLNDFRIEGHPLVSSYRRKEAELIVQTTFRTEEDGEHVGDEYFLNSGDKVSLGQASAFTAHHVELGIMATHGQIRYFLEPSSLSPATPTSPAKLLVPPAQSINKIGHALATLDPVFRRYTLENDRMTMLAKELGEHTSPRVLQSLIICKQPKIGGKGVPENVRV